MVHPVSSPLANQPNSPSASKTEWFLTDRMGTPQAIINNSGAIVEKYDYGTFGDPLVGSGLSLPTIGFTGREFDSETGLMYYRARYYDPNMGRFLSEDPIGFAGGDSNLQRYVGNAVFRFLDPSGNDVKEYQATTKEGQKNAVAAGNLNATVARNAKVAGDALGGPKGSLAGRPLTPEQIVQLEKNLYDTAKNVERAINGELSTKTLTEAVFRKGLERIEKILEILARGTTG